MFKRGGVLSGPGIALALAAILGGLLLGGCAAGNDGLAVGDPAPAFDLPSTSGARVALSDFEGRPVLLFFHMAVG
jgi:cytochrome oxidase Cu insertion factor (SCO1/SenC/PrrC family)